MPRAQRAAAARGRRGVEAGGAAPRVDTHRRAPERLHARYVAVGFCARASGMRRGGARHTA